MEIYYECTTPPNTLSVRELLSLKFGAIVLTALITQSAYANTDTACEMIDANPPRLFFCETHTSGAPTLVSQVWSLTTGGIILQQGTGFMAAQCGGSTNLGYQYIAVLSDGTTDTGFGSLPCQDGGGSGPCGGPIVLGCTIRPK